MAYNLTGIAAETTVSGLLTGVNSASGGILFNGLILAIFVILLLAMVKWGFSSALMVAGWTTFIISAVLWFGGLVGLFTVLACLTVAAFAVFYEYTLT